jgi:hypothetical protein
MIIRLNYISLFLVLIILHLPGQSEIGHFDDSVIGQKDVAGGQIAVQYLLGYIQDIFIKFLIADCDCHLFAGQEFHASSNLV